MLKIALLTLAIFASVQASSLRDTEISDAAAAGNWDLIRALIKQRFRNMDIWEPSFAKGSVRSLKPSPGGHVYGESQFSFHSATDVGGKKFEKSGGHKIINNDGKIEEYDFDPKF